jgi:hypothetical protein
MARTPNQDESTQEPKVVLVALETFTPYKKGEVFAVTEKEAEAVLTPNLRNNDFGPIYPGVKVRKYDPESDAHLLLKNGVLNRKEHRALSAKLRAAA